MCSSTSYIFSYLDVEHTQVNFKKHTMGATSGRKAEIYIFARSVSISSPSIAIEFRALGNCVLSKTHFRLVVHISTRRYSSKFRVLGERTHIERILPTPRTHFNHSKPIEVSTTWLKDTYRQDTFEWFSRVKTVTITVLTAESNLDYAKLLQNPILK